ncbi:DNA replication protein DnaD [Enterococcus saigonensis]|uniref:DNA replication protein DnaD n=1 Tax=Enterococcus saigonensis TaxID=1805431 RepID=A0A679I870_9ENTE|nr:DnaD domain protein [Enterococcus saigonensis]BCA85778.1 DNA replication protein DnaD [Enterococcus saigonensis]
MLALDDYFAAGQTVISNLILDYYHELGLSSEELVFWLQLYRHHEQGDHFPDLSQIATEMGVAQQQIFELLNQLVLKQVIKIETVVVDNKQQDHYLFTPIFEKIAQLLAQKKKDNKQQGQQQEISQMFLHFQQEFGRPLSSFEYERIAQWLEEDNYSPEIIILALKEAVLNNARSLQYIESILSSWRSKNIQSAQDVASDKTRYQKQKAKPNSNKELSPYSLQNWLKGE